MLFNLFQLRLIWKVYKEKELREEDLFHLPVEQDASRLVA